MNKHAWQKVLLFIEETYCLGTIELLCARLLFLEENGFSYQIGIRESSLWSRDLIACGRKFEKAQLELLMKI